MKRVMLMMVLAALLLTQCRRPSIEFPSAEVSMTVTAGPGSKTDIYTTGGIVWSTGDKLYVGCNGKYAGCLSIVSGVGDPTGTFTGTVTGVSEGTQEFHFFYLGNANYELTTSSASVAVDFSNQDIYADGGKLVNANRQHVGYGAASGKVDGGAVIGVLDVAMKSKVAIAYFHFESGETPTPYEGALTLGGDHIYNSMTVGFGGTFSPGTKGNISLAGGHAGRYVMLVPPENVANETLNFSGDAEGSTTLANGIEANKFYRVDGSMPIVVKVKLHETVNFGTPNLNWSKYNLGVDPAKLTNAWDWYGDYYAWGEVVPYYTSLTWKSATSCTVNGWNTEATLGGGGTVDATKGYKWQSYSHGSDSFIEWNVSPCTGSVPYDSDNKLLLPARDAATAVWGEGWRMPTAEEWQSLYVNNTFELLAADAASEHVPTFTAPCAGCLVVKGKEASKDASVYMFLPAAGYRNGTSLSGAGSRSGCYWSSSLSTDYPYFAYRLYFYSGSVNPQSNVTRYNGLSVRPVRDTPLSGGGTTNDFGQGTW